ncbi:MAG TPA: T9SS type A sorting domain-containing protein [Puia sp.]|nr:T9SS type A sorting domain-containing protein [Puia sp.]
MKTNIPWNSYGRPICIRAICLLALASLTRQGHAQCAAAPIAPAACSGGNGAATNGVNINSGNTYWVNTGSTFSNINLNGGILRICSNLTLSTLSFNSGTLIVESGGTLSISALASQYLNGNSVIINRGVISISGNITFQNSNNAVYNELSTSVFNVSGIVTVNSSTTTISNNGTMNLSGLYYQGETGGFCVGPESLTTIYSLNNITTNSFTYSGSGAPSCLNVTGSATLTDRLTNSSVIHVCQGFSGTAGGAGGWGSATVTTGCSSCTTVLPLGVESFTATAQGSVVQLHWKAGQGPDDNGIFYAEKSTDGSRFETFAMVTAVAGGSNYTLTDPAITAPKLYYRIRAVNNTGVTMYSTIALVETAVNGQLQLFPNPAGPNTAVTLLIPAASGANARISLINMAGQVLSTKIAALTAGSNTVSWSLADLSAGVYLIRIEIAGDNLYARLAVRPN